VRLLYVAVAFTESHGCGCHSRNGPSDFAGGPLRWISESTSIRRASWVASFTLEAGQVRFAPYSGATHPTSLPFPEDEAGVVQVDGPDSKIHAHSS